MVNPDISDRAYIAEVIRVSDKTDRAIAALSKLASGPIQETIVGDDEENPIKLIHSFLASSTRYHRSERDVVMDSGERVNVPRRIGRGRSEQFLYDVVIARQKGHILVAVPFHGLAEEFFVQADRALAGTGARYEKLDITNLIVRLGSKGAVRLESKGAGEATLSVTRCHLAYTYTDRRTRDLQQIQMTGTNLGATSQYQTLISPIVHSAKGAVVKPTPVILGFALAMNGVRKATATTDRHGNFKLWVAPGLRRLIRIFALLDALESIDNVVSATSNVPILQSGTIRETEDTA